ncbi:MAG: hypothetical protein QW136_01125 [Nitrososphaerales archaeon]
MWDPSSKTYVWKPDQEENARSYQTGGDNLIFDPAVHTMKPKNPLQTGIVATTESPPCPYCGDTKPGKPVRYPRNFEECQKCGRKANRHIQPKFYVGQKVRLKEETPPDISEIYKGSEGTIISMGQNNVNGLWLYKVSFPLLHPIEENPNAVGTLKDGDLFPTFTPEEREAIERGEASFPHPQAGKTEYISIHGDDDLEAVEDYIPEFGLSDREPGDLYPPAHWFSHHRKANYYGWTNWDTWEVNNWIIDNPNTFKAALEASEYGTNLEGLRDWAIEEIIGPINKRAVEMAKEWNSFPIEERIDEDWESLRDILPKTNLIQTLEDLGMGPDVSDIQPRLIDHNKVNWLEIANALREDTTLGRTAAMGGWSNITTWYVYSLIATDSHLFDEAIRVSEYGTNLEAFKDWVLENIIGPHNRDALIGLHTYEDSPEERALMDYLEEHDYTEEYLEAFDQKPTYTPGPVLIDLDEVNWLELMNNMNDASFMPPITQIQEQEYLPDDQPGTTTFPEEWVSSHQLDENEDEEAQEEDWDVLPNDPKAPHSQFHSWPQRVPKRNRMKSDDSYPSRISKELIQDYIKNGNWYTTLSSYLTIKAWVKERNNGIVYDPSYALVAHNLDGLELDDIPICIIISGEDPRAIEFSNQGTTVIANIGQEYNKINTGNYLIVDPFNKDITVMYDINKSKFQFAHIKEELAWRQANPVNLDSCPECNGPLTEKYNSATGRLEKLCYDCGYRQPIIHNQPQQEPQASQQHVAVAPVVGLAAGLLSRPLIGRLMSGALGRGIGIGAGMGLGKELFDTGADIVMPGQPSPNASLPGPSLVPGQNLYSKHTKAAEDWPVNLYVLTYDIDYDQEVKEIVGSAANASGFGPEGRDLVWYDIPLSKALEAQKELEVTPGVVEVKIGPTNSDLDEIRSLPEIEPGNRLSKQRTSGDSDDVGIATKNRGEDSDPAHNSSGMNSEEKGDSPEQLKHVDEGASKKPTNKNADKDKEAYAIKAFECNLPLVIEYAFSDKPGSEHPILKALDELLEEVWPGYKDVVEEVEELTGIDIDQDDEEGESKEHAEKVKSESDEEDDEEDEEDSEKAQEEREDKEAATKVAEYFEDIFDDNGVVDLAFAINSGQELALVTAVVDAYEYENIIKIVEDNVPAVALPHEPGGSIVVATFATLSDYAEDLAVDLKTMSGVYSVNVDRSYEWRNDPEVINAIDAALEQRFSKQASEFERASYFVIDPQTDKIIGLIIRWNSDGTAQMQTKDGIKTINPDEYKIEKTSSEQSDDNNEKDSGEVDQEDRLVWVTDSLQPLEEGKDYHLFTSGYAIPDLVTITKITPDRLRFIIHADEVDYEDEITKQDQHNYRYVFKPASHERVDSMSDYETQEDYIRPGDDPLPQVTDLSKPPTKVSVFHEAGRQFTVREQREFIEEEGPARNLHKLNLADTHYIENQVTTDEFLW